MNNELFSRWQQGRPPFHASTLCCKNILPLRDVRRAVQQIVEVLKPRYENSMLWRLRDWHEHDGFVLDAVASTWIDLEMLLASDDLFYQSRAGDDGVRVAWYPSHVSFLLRYYLDEENNDPNCPGHWGDFDLSGSVELLAAVQQRFAPLLRVELQEKPTKQYFDRRYGG